MSGLLAGERRISVAVAWFLLAVTPALAQAHNPFSVGISEGGGSATGITGWLLAQQGWLEHQLSLGVRAARLGGGLWPLVGMGFVYGVFHAAGPGHGKAVLSSYMVANERALRRGIGLSFAAALLQGLVAIALIGVMTLVLHATAQRMKDAASLIETASFLAIVALGLSLVWRKGLALRRTWRATRDPWARFGGGSRSAAPAMAFAGPAVTSLGGNRGAIVSRFACDAAEVAHPADCTHCHGPDPRSLTDQSIDWRAAGATMLAAGLRPCSGAILVLVFAFAQGVFPAGVLAVLAMSFGVALTTAALASTAVLFKATATRLIGRRSPWAALVGAGVELLAAGVVLLAGILLLAGQAASIGAT
ncbi:hypothetical protein P7D22_02555 [Lichenihabitans sp. Uapishka_5]|uniref:nickel/cobalt transporter n=1 Tax=Lichenihabitans sp. Uapishka_5 TaxID=3037302 RepID=UPI0029E7E1DD|nr:hypothetical protein [Lichenihabitans sp. Uapishka_5]MDX7950056.1 hypothetical protein [Lichenihabitans sp. Uapishka_5]